MTIIIKSHADMKFAQCISNTYVLRETHTVVCGWSGLHGDSVCLSPQSNMAVRTPDTVTGCVLLVLACWCHL